MADAQGAYEMAEHDGEWPCLRVERGEQHLPHLWRWYGQHIVALHHCPGLGISARAERSAP